MKKFFFLVFVTLLSMPTFAQWSIGGSVGLVYNHPFMHYSKYSFYEYSGHLGLSFDLPIYYHLDDNWSFSTGLSCQQKGYHVVTKTASSDILSSTKYSDWYVSLPLLTAFSFAKTKRGEFFVDGGLYVAYWCYSKYRFTMKDEIGVLHEEHEDDPIYKELNNNVYNRFEFGLIGGMGYKHHLGEKWACFMVIRYQYALTRQINEPQTLSFFRRNNSIVSQMGILYNIKK